MFQTIDFKYKKATRRNELPLFYRQIMYMNNQPGSSGYLKFIAENPHLLAFGFALTFASSLGQTFFIGSFGPSILKEFELSHTAWGSIYMSGTILSALCLPFT